MTAAATVQARRHRETSVIDGLKRVPWIEIGETIFFSAGAVVCGYVAAAMFTAGAGFFGFALGVLYLGFAVMCAGVVVTVWVPALSY